MHDKNGNIVFDPTGGGSYGMNGVENGGHVWFPNYDNVKELLQKTMFKNIDFLCYHTKEEEVVMKDIDFSLGHINRIPTEIRERELIYSIVVDCRKR